MLLYRFERLDFLSSMLRSGSVSLSHPSKWADPYEFSFLTAGRVVVRGALVQGPDGMYRGNLPRRQDSVVANMTMSNPFGRFVFAQCFTEVPETERLWLWAQSDDRIRWCVDAHEYLVAARQAAGEHTVTIEEVNYLPANAVDEVHQEFVQKYGGGVGMNVFEQWSHDVKVPLRTKRKEFADEHEHRVILIDTTWMRIPKGPGSPPPPLIVEKDRFPLAIPMQNFIREVCLHPNASQTEIDEVTSQLRATGYRGSIIKSNLYKAPVLSKFVDRPIDP